MAPWLDSACAWDRQALPAERWRASEIHTSTRNTTSMAITKCDNAAGYVITRSFSCVLTCGDVRRRMKAMRRGFFLYVRLHLCLCILGLASLILVVFHCSSPERTVRRLCECARNGPRSKAPRPAAGSRSAERKSAAGRWHSPHCRPASGT